MKPVVIQVFGDKSRKLEPEHHRIEFPGGYISVDRTTDGRYWAHISINPEIPEWQEGERRARGLFVESRVDFNYTEYKRRHDAGETVIPNIPGMSVDDLAPQANHFAVCIKPVWED